MCRVKGHKSSKHFFLDEIFEVNLNLKKKKSGWETEEKESLEPMEEAQRRELSSSI